MLKNFKKNNNKGFTLVELLVVIAIIGVLAVVAVPSLMKNLNKAKAADAIAYISACKSAAISKYAEDTDATSLDITADVEGKAPTGVKVAATANNGQVTVTVTLDAPFNETTLKDQITKSFDQDGIVTFSK